MKARGKQDQAGGKPTWAAAPAKSQPTELFSLGQEGARREGWAFTPLPGADPGTPRTLVRQVSEAEAVPTGIAGPSLRGSEVMESGRYLGRPGYALLQAPARPQPGREAVAAQRSAPPPLDLQDLGLDRASRSPHASRVSLLRPQHPLPNTAASSLPRSKGRAPQSSKNLPKTCPLSHTPSLRAKLTPWWSGLSLRPRGAQLP